MENSWSNEQFSSVAAKHTNSTIFQAEFFCSVKKHFGVASDVTQHDLSITFRGKIFRKKNDSNNINAQPKVKKICINTEYFFINVENFRSAHSTSKYDKNGSEGG